MPALRGTALQPQERAALSHGELLSIARPTPKRLCGRRRPEQPARVVGRDRPAVPGGRSPAEVRRLRQSALQRQPGFAGIVADAAGALDMAYFVQLNAWYSL